MKDWKDILVELAKKLTALFAFVVMLVIVIALLGKNIPEVFSALIYILAIGGLLVYAVLQFIQIRAKSPPEMSKQPSVIEPALPVVAPVPPVAPPSVPPLPVDSLTARECYLRAVIKECRTIRLAGLDPNASDPNRGGMSLEKLYVSLDTQTQKEKPEGKGKKESPIEREEREPLSALAALVTSVKQRMVLLGLPGTGKSTFVRYLALNMATAELHREAELPSEWKGGPLLPFMVSLGRFAETLPPGCRKGHAELIENYLTQSLKDGEDTADFAPDALASLAREGGLVMFDGLDEVANLNLRPLVVQAVEDFVEKYSRNSASRFLVTCRTYSYQHDASWRLTGWESHELALLSRAKIEYFVRAWYEELGLIESSRKDEFAHKRDKLLASLTPGDRRRLLDIAPFPIILTMMAVVHTHSGELPDTRAQVYERCVELLLIRWQSERSVEGKKRQQNILDALNISPTVIYQAMWEVAYKAHEGRKRDASDGGEAALVTEDILSGILKVYLQEQSKVETFLEYCQSSNGLLMLQGTLAQPGKPLRRLYAFPHLTFEEYLAARYLADLEPDNYAYELIGKSDRWREAVKLLGEHLCFGSPQRPQMSALLDALADEKKAAPQERARMTWLAGELLPLYRHAFPSKPAPSDERIFAQLQETALNMEFDPRLRADCADLADELGYDPGDLPAFISITQSPNQPFSMAKYPVTNAQYARFLTPENFENRDLWRGFPKFGEFDDKNLGKSCRELGKWKEEGWDWLQKTLKDTDSASDGRIVLPRYWTDPRFGLARKNAPVVGISWYEASAYCKWLMENWENLEESKQGLPRPKEIRLPTENEWILAAGGAENNRFAWDKEKPTEKEDEIYQRANVNQQVGRTTPVWMYPQGASEPHKIMDMSGNVWEWQVNHRDKDHDVLGLRGGSWLNLPGYARVSYRDLSNRFYRPDGIGFRVCALPSDGFVS